MSDPLDDYAEMTKMWITFHAARPDVELSWFLQHYKDGALLPPVEPPVLSREFLDSLIEGTLNDLGAKYGYHMEQRAIRNVALREFRDAILESLSQEDGE